MKETSKLYLHPITGEPKFKTSDFHVLEKGVSPEGIHLKAFRAKNPAVSGGFQHGIQYEVPGQGPKFVFGTYQEIANLRESIKAKGIPAVVERLRLLGEGTYYSLNKPAPEVSHTWPDKETTKTFLRAKRMFPNHDKENNLTSLEQEEKLSLKAHQLKLAREATTFPDSAEGQQKVQELLDPKATAPSTLITAEVE